MELAPIAVLTYTRLNHLKQTVTALQKNKLAQDSTIFFFSDAPKQGDESKVELLRKYLHTIKGFKKIHIIERQVNDYIRNTVGSVEEILNTYERGIFLEDDIITAPGFLTFMNSALNFYESDEKIFSISGYTPPISIPKYYNKDYFTLRRFCGWGNVIWKHKYVKVKSITEEAFEGLTKKDIRSLNLYGEDLYRMVAAQTRKEIDANDVNIMFHQFNYDKYTIYPRKSLVQNIGHDGSGVHCGVNDKFHHDKLWEKESDFEFLNDIRVNEKIRKANYDFRMVPKIGIRKQIVNFIKNTRTYSMLKTFKNKVI
ncbi:MAG: sugar transferase [gamma proteobacterium symbiont of Taylorina sp.]|nr:sugar transferase [gamma proteobacterium symbiont of Taylorina sp.]